MSWAKPVRVKAKAALSRSKIETPMMSAGSRSLVNWNALEVEADELGHHVREGRLAHPGHVLDEQDGPDATKEMPAKALLGIPEVPASPPPGRQGPGCVRKPPGKGHDACTPSGEMSFVAIPKATGKSRFPMPRGHFAVSRCPIIAPRRPWGADHVSRRRL
jgi:hypothetical protein